MRPHPSVTAVVTAVLVLHGLGAAEPDRGPPAVSPHRLMAAVLAQFRSDADLDTLVRSARLIAPRVHELDQRHGAGVERALAAALAASDRRRALEAVMAVAVLEAEEQLDAIHRDDFTGWADAKVEVKKAVLFYGLLAADVRGSHPREGSRILQHFSGLVEALRSADLSTDPAVIGDRRDLVVRDLTSLRATLAPRARR